MSNFYTKILFLNLFFWSFIFPNFSYSQNNSSKEYKKGDIDWYISPLALLEPRPTIYLSAEYFIKDRVSIHTDLGYMINLTGTELLNDSTWNTDRRFGSVGPAILDASKLNLVIKPEIRWYTQGSSRRDYAFYCGLKLLLRTAHFQKTQVGSEEYFYSTLTNNWTGIGDDILSTYAVRRNTIGLQFVVGKKDGLFKTGTSNLFVAVGVRYITNKPLKKVFNPFDNGNDRLKDFNLDFLDFSQQYKFVTMDFALGVRFGGRIK